MLGRYMTFGESDKFAEILKEAVAQPDINATCWVNNEGNLNISEDLINRLKEISRGEKQLLYCQLKVRREPIKKIPR